MKNLRVAQAEETMKCMGIVMFWVEFYMSLDVVILSQNGVLSLKKHFFVKCEKEHERETFKLYLCLCSFIRNCKKNLSLQSSMKAFRIHIGYLKIVFIIICKLPEIGLKGGVQCWLSVLFVAPTDTQ